MTFGETIKSKLSEALPKLQQKYPIARMGLFGSVTRSDYNPTKSDIDILVELNGDMGYEFIELAERLEDILQKKVDLVSKDALKPYHWLYLQSKILYV